MLTRPPETRARGLQEVIEFVQYDARLNPTTALDRIKLEYAVEIFAVIYYQSPVYRLPALGRTAAPGQNRHPGFTGVVKRGLDVFVRFRHHYTVRDNLIVRCISGVASATKQIKVDLAING